MSLRDRRLTTGKGGMAAIDSLGHMDTIAHAHAEGGFIELDLDVTGGTPVDVVLIDISDTTNYPHDNTSWIHNANLEINVDSESAADYDIRIGFIENCDADGGDFYQVWHFSGTKQTGNSFKEIYGLNPEAPKLSTIYFKSSIIQLAESAFQNDGGSLLISTHDLSTANITPNDGDLIMRVTTTGGSNSNFNISLLFGYHSH